MTQIKFAQVNIGSFLLAFRFDGKIFDVELQSTCALKKEAKYQGKTSAILYPKIQ